MRHIFGLSLFTPTSRDDRYVGMDPGIEKMMEFEKRARLRARLPPVKDIEEALNVFTFKKWKSRAAVTDTQARLLGQCFAYAFEAQRNEADGRSGPLSTELSLAIRDANRLLSHEGGICGQDHVDLARLLFEEGRLRPEIRQDRTLHALITTLCNAGQPGEARTVLLQEESSVLATLPSNSDTTDSDTPNGKDDLEQSERRSLKVAWRHILRTFATQDNEPDVLKTLKILQKYEIAKVRAVARIMVEFYAKRGDISNLKTWFNTWRNTPLSKTAATYDAVTEARILRVVLSSCQVNEQIELGHEFVRLVLADTPMKATWDEILAFALGTGKSVDEVDRMIDVMAEASSKDHDSVWGQPNIQTINRLIETAIAANEPYMAERLIHIGQARGMQPDARTCVLQMEYRMAVGDIDGALTAYKHLQGKDLGLHEHFDATNKLVVALCNSRRHDFDTVMNVVADLADQRAPFAVDTVITLSLVHLRRDELHDVTDLLRTHAPNFSSADRLKVQEALRNFCLDKDTPLAHVWDAYGILRAEFDETARDIRTQIMQAFFHHDRADLAVQVFNHMRRHSRGDTIPVSETYLIAFLECAKLKELDSFEVLHNQLKLDHNIDIDTRLRNAMLMAFTACAQSSDAFGVWDDIVDSREGPTYNSLHIVFRAAEITPFGDIKARHIWNKLRKDNVEVDDTLWASYIGALAGNGDIEQAITALQEGVTNDDVQVNDFMVGTLYNVAAGLGKDQVVEEWAQQEYPDVWQSLRKTGRQQTATGTHLFRIDRAVQP